MIIKQNNANIFSWRCSWTRGKFGLWRRRWNMKWWWQRQGRPLTALNIGTADGSTSAFLREGKGYAITAHIYTFCLHLRPKKNRSCCRFPPMKRTKRTEWQILVKVQHKKASNWGEFMKYYNPNLVGFRSALHQADSNVRCCLGC